MFFQCSALLFQLDSYLKCFVLTMNDCNTEGSRSTSYYRLWCLPIRLVNVHLSTLFVSTYIDIYTG
uniref:Uncharacterized protein n=1 Tax=Arundo donax TaxID=35708 RepID=A0A0A9G0V4_ARUDO